MGIEENINRIATALETIAEVQSRMLTIAEWNKERLSGKSESPDRALEAEPEVEEPKETTAVPPEQVPAHQWSYDELKAELLKRGVEVAKGTKMTTLLKFWEAHKLDPEMQIPESAAKQEEPKETTVPVKQEDDIFSMPQEAKTEPVEKKPMTELDARKHIMEKGYKGTPEQIVVMKKALASVGKATFKELVEGEYDKLIAEFDRLMEEK